MVNWATDAMVPTREAVRILTQKLGSYINWSWFLLEDRRIRKHGKPPKIPFYRLPASRLIFYRFADLEEFIDSKINAKNGRNV
jgi:hypothetical protein